MRVTHVATCLRACLGCVVLGHIGAVTTVDVGLILLFLHTSCILVIGKLASATGGRRLVGVVVLTVASCHHGGLWSIRVGLTLLCYVLQGCLLVCPIL